MDYLRSAPSSDVKAVMEHCRDLRSTHRSHNNGYTHDKTMRHVMSFHPSVISHPEFSKYFDPQMDPHERRKGMYAFARKHPEYLVVDKL